MLFVLVVETSTYAVVMAALDSNPRALVSASPLIPNAGPVFVAQVVLRAILVCWTAVHLVIVRGRLPVLLSTLTATGKEIVGAHVEKRLAGLDIASVSLLAAFRVYVAMSKPSRRIKTWANGWLVRRELAAEAEEERQVGNVVDALEDLERRQQLQLVGGISEASPDRSPTGPGSPTVAAVGSNGANAAPERRRREAAIALVPDVPRRRRKRRAANVETRIRALLAGEPTLGPKEIARRLHISDSTASKWKGIVAAEGQAQRDAQQMAR